MKSGKLPGLLSDDELAAAFEMTLDEVIALGIPHATIGRKRFFSEQAVIDWVNEQQRLQASERHVHQ